jgi:hypothetical protein
VWVSTESRPASQAYESGGEPPFGSAEDKAALKMGLNFVAKDDVEENGEVVAGTSGDDENVPNRVAEWKAASCEECDANGIEKAAREEPVEAVRRNGGK